jgi:DNA invertase Pin-like site-specific DNA recombinase
MYLRQGLPVASRSAVVNESGYVRFSTHGQTFSAQDVALHAAGCAKVYSEKVSGAVTDRKALAKALAVLQKGDTLIVTRLDRLARSTRDLLNTLDTITRTGAGFRSLADTWGRYYHAARPLDADRAWRLSGI